MSKLSRQERELLKSYDGGGWRSVANLEEEKEKFQKIAAATLKKHRVSIRITDKDLQTIQKRAAAKGVSHETLIANVIHKYVSGRLVEKKP
jgi:predicted DNA binding CopG/RHH family protein